MNTPCSYIIQYCKASIKFLYITFLKGSILYGTSVTSSIFTLYVSISNEEIPWSQDCTGNYLLSEGSLLSALSDTRDNPSRVSGSAETCILTRKLGQTRKKCTCFFPPMCQYPSSQVVLAN